MNSVILIGRVCADPEIHGGTVAKFQLAVDKRAKDGVKQADFFPVVAFGKTAEIACQYAKKGTLIALSGRLDQRDFVRQDGTKGREFAVIVNELKLLSSPRREENSW